MFYYYWNDYYQNNKDNFLFYSTQQKFNIRNYLRRKDNEVIQLKVNIYNEGKCSQFESFSKLISKIQNVKELEISIDIKFQREKNNSDSKVKEIFDFLIDTIIPQFKDTLESIKFTYFHIQEKSDKDEQQTIKKYLLKILQPLNSLRAVSFSQELLEISSSSFYGLQKFLSLLKEKSLALPNLKLLNFEFQQTENQVNLKYFNQQEMQTSMLNIAKDLSKLKQLEELKIKIQNLGLEKVFFENLLKSIIQMKKLKQLCLDITGNRITPEISLKNVKLLTDLSKKLEKFIYIDSQNLKSSTIQGFSQALRNFQNLKFLQLDKFSFKEGQSTDFFSFLSFMPHIEEIKFNLVNVSLSENDFNYFVKQVKQLENLSSIQLVLPEENQYLSENTVLNLIDIITHFKDQLIYLSLEFYSDIKYAESQLLINAISKVEKLKKIEFQFKIQNRQHFFSLDSKKQNAENIWNLKSAEFIPADNKYQRIINFVEFIILLKLRIAQNQNNQILEEMKILQNSISPYQLQVSQIIQNQLSELNKYSNLKTLLYTSNDSLQSFKDLSQILIQNNLNSLTNLVVDNYFKIEAQDILKLVKQCKSLQYLGISVKQVSNNFLEQLFSDLIFLQKLYIGQAKKVLIDQIVFKNANYLTDFKCTYSDKLEIMRMINERKVFILQNIIYSQIIQPQIIYQPQLSHIDIFID